MFLKSIQHNKLFFYSTKIIKNYFSPSSFIKKNFILKKKNFLFLNKQKYYLTTTTTKKIENKDLQKKLEKIIGKESTTQFFDGSKEILLNEISIGEQGAELISEVLKINTSIEKLFFSTNNIGPKGVSFITKALAYNNTLLELSFILNPIKIEGAKAFSELFQSHHNKTLKTLEFTSCDLNDEGTEILVNSLHKNYSLENLYLICNSIHNKGVKSLTKFVKNSKTLKILDLSGNSIRGTIFSQFCEALSNEHKYDGQLFELNLTANQLQVEDSKTIAKLLVTNDTIKTLRLGGNELEDEGIAEISKALEKNTKLHSLDLNANGITDTGAENIIELLKVNKSINNLEIYGNNISEEIQKKLKSFETQTRKIIIDSDFQSSSEEE